MSWTAQRTLNAESNKVWDVLTDVTTWNQWSPTVKTVSLQGDQLRAGASGTITTIAGIQLAFTITRFEPYKRWAWVVANTIATDHLVQRQGPNKTTVSVNIPWYACAYLPVCQKALRQFDVLVTKQDPSP